MARNELKFGVGDPWKPETAKGITVLPGTLISAETLQGFGNRINTSYGVAVREASEFFGQALYVCNDGKGETTRIIFEQDNDSKTCDASAQFRFVRAEKVKMEGRNPIVEHLLNPVTFYLESEGGAGSEE